jgi:pyruvate formate lyase activating enzyme
MNIAGLSKTTLLDYPGYVAATIFTVACNFRCPFCQNSQLLETASPDSPLISEEELLEFLEKRKKVLTGVCISGGEPTLQADLSSFVRQIKDKGYLVKLDTNGYRPEVVRGLIEENLLDYIAIDVKNSKDKYPQTAGFANIDVNKIEETFEIIKNSGIGYEFRTTVVKELHVFDDLLAIGEWLGRGASWYLQSFVESENVLQKGFTAYSPTEMVAFTTALKEKGVENVKVRGS